MMLRALVFSISIILFCACGSENSIPFSDSVSTDSAITAGLPEKVEYAVVHAHAITVLKPLPIPCWMNVDDQRDSALQVSHEEAIALFPLNFGIPQEVMVVAFAKQEIDSSLHAIWYKMNVPGTENADIWMVLYDNSGPKEAHLAATKGNGIGYAKIDSPTSMREVFMPSSEKTVVTAKNVKIENGHFVTSDEQTSTFGIGREANGQAYIDQFFE